jgi:hypothetical protein
MAMRNTITLEQFIAMMPEEKREVSIESLQALGDELGALALQYKTYSEGLFGALDERFKTRAALRRTEEQKDFGVIRILDGPATISCDLPKKVEWDQEKLAEISRMIANSGRDPKTYINITYDVPERNYTAWPADIRATFEPARTVKPGKPKYTIEFPGEK